jgi:hypothetical protein
MGQLGPWWPSRADEVCAVMVTVNQTFRQTVVDVATS